jgi:hypothetical protein
MAQNNQPQQPVSGGGRVREQSAPTPRLGLTVNEFCRAIGICRTSFYELVNSKKIRTVLIAGRRIVPISEADRLLQDGA